MTRMPYTEASSAPAAQTRNGDRAVAAWLLACCALVFSMVVVGGVTRLTHSGLSIVEWQPIVGALPPLDEAGWQETFGKYKRTPEYRLVNPGMNLEGFKGIFWWEYVHRLLGRLIGAAFLLPLLWFALRGGIARLIYAAMLWVAFDLLFPRASPVSGRLRRFASVLSALIFVMVLSGGLVAGTRAGLAYN